MKYLIRFLILALWCMLASFIGQEIRENAVRWLYLWGYVAGSVGMIIVEAGR